MTNADVATERASRVTLPFATIAASPLSRAVKKEEEPPNRCPTPAAPPVGTADENGRTRVASTAGSTNRR